MLLKIEVCQFLLNKFAAVLSFICLVSLSGTLSAATVSLVDNSKSSIGCEVKLEGVIEEGDVERLTAAIVEVKSRRDYWLDAVLNSYDFRVCFNSPGGSYLEGIEIARIIDVPTGVDEGDICESACFLAFMSGINTTFQENDFGVVWQDRVMHPLASVGYHAPALNIKAGNFSAEEVNKAYRIALFSVAELIKLRKEKYGSYIFRDYLFEDMLRIPPNKMKHIRTVEQAIKAQIMVFPVVFPGVEKSLENASQYPQDKNYGGFAHACRAMGLMVDDFGVDEGPHRPKISTDQGYVFFSAAFDLGESGTGCELHQSIPDGSTSTWFVGDGSAKDGDANIGTQGSLAAFMYYPPLTEINTLKYPFNHAELNLEFLSGFGGKDDKRLLSCAVGDTTARVTNVQNFTNLRRQAGMNGQVTGPVPLGAQLSVINPGNFLRTDRCAAACNGTNQNAVKQCIDNNDVWIEVEYIGRRGFLSRKFLE
ncbi:hypothetical protein pfor_12c1417 [Rhodobacteraceae bacterium SB2]|nr:hypothetical protein pfor_12c1417 [Rhodobacteraceae bacterium SB2]